MKSNLSRNLSLFIAVTFLVGLTGIYSPAQPSKAKPDHYVRVRVINSAIKIIDELTSLGATKLLEDEGETLWKLSEKHADKFRERKREGVLVAGYLGVVSVGGQLFDPSQETPVVPSHLRQKRSNEPQMWLVQFIGPTKSQWEEQIKKLGIKIVASLGTQAVVWLDGTQLKMLENVAKDPKYYIYWTTEYHPAYRLERRAWEVASKQFHWPWETVRINVSVYETANLEQSLAKLRKLGGKSFIPSTDYLNKVHVTLTIPANQLSNIANWPDVHYVSIQQDSKFADEGSNQLLAGNYTTNNGNTTPVYQNGYLNWLLIEKGFLRSPLLYPIVAVIDGGSDYTVLATVLEADTTAIFNLTNFSPCLQPFVVTSDYDNGLNRECGKLTRALLQATPSTTISFNLGVENSVTIADDALGDVPSGVFLDGGACVDGTGARVNPVRIISLGNLAPLINGLTINNNTQLRNIQVSGFSGNQIAVKGTGNRFLCGVSAYKITP